MSIDLSQDGKVALDYYYSYYFPASRPFNMDSQPSIHDRIFEAANALYQEAGRQTFPTVDAVRKLARVNMNDASTGMKEWRRTQSTQIAPITVQVPLSLQQSSVVALNSLWMEAVTHANESLRIAQSGWETEKAEVEALREQMASAFEAQGAELAAAQRQLVNAQSEITRLNEAVTAARVEHANLSQQLAVTTAATHQAEARATEIERRTNDLRMELDHAHRTAEGTAAELRSTRDLYAKEIDALKINLEQVNRSNELKDVSAREALVRAREEAANLRGKLEVFLSQQPVFKEEKRTSTKPDGATSK